MRILSKNILSLQLQSIFKIFENQIWLKISIHCDVVLFSRMTNEKLMCMTSSSVNGVGEKDVEVDFGGYKRLLNSKFTFENDPEINYIYRNHSIARYSQHLSNMESRLKFTSSFGDPSSSMQWFLIFFTLLWKLCRSDLHLKGLLFDKIKLSML